MKNPQDLQLDFQPVLDLYCRGKGKSLAVQIGIDWAIWSEKIKSNARTHLLDAICGIPVSKHQYILRGRNELEANARKTWKIFSEELKYKNRFFHSKDRVPNLDVFEQFMDQFRLQNLPTRLFRARINEDNMGCNPYTIENMKKPPSDCAKSGRANPSGISYLYASSCLDGAIHEVRPHIGAHVSVVELQITNPRIYIVDLRFKDGAISPFGFDDLEAFSHEIPLLKLLDVEMSRAISPKRSELDYLPIQYLCESIKRLGAVGIAYKSVAYKKSSNYVFFSDEHIKYCSVKSYSVYENSLKFDESK